MRPHLGKGCRCPASVNRSFVTHNLKRAFEMGSPTQRGASASPALVSSLLTWHETTRRSYPWRELHSPWLIIAAEMLLRRTRADAVAAMWSRFEAAFPTPGHVVRDPESCRMLLRSLGLRWRVENLIDLAHALEVRHAGSVPRSREALMELPGVGQYVATAVMAFGHGVAGPLVDSNTARIAYRVQGEDRGGTDLRRRRVRELVEKLSGDQPATPELNLALLDLGGTVCLPHQPRCGVCPIRGYCAYAASVTADQATRIERSPDRRSGVRRQTRGRPRSELARR